MGGMILSNQPKIVKFTINSLRLKWYSPHSLHVNLGGVVIAHLAKVMYFV